MGPNRRRPNISMQRELENGLAQLVQHRDNLTKMEADLKSSLEQAKEEERLLVQQIEDLIQDGREDAAAIDSEHAPVSHQEEGAAAPIADIAASEVVRLPGFPELLGMLKEMNESDDEEDDGAAAAARLCSGEDVPADDNVALEIENTLAEFGAVHEQQFAALLTAKTFSRPAQHGNPNPPG